MSTHQSIRTQVLILKQKRGEKLASMFCPAGHTHSANSHPTAQVGDVSWEQTVISKEGCEESHNFSSQAVDGPTDWTKWSVSNLFCSLEKYTERTKHQDWKMRGKANTKLRNHPLSPRCGRCGRVGHLRKPIPVREWGNAVRKKCLR